MITSACYCTREQVQNALDYSSTARNSDQVDRAIESARDAVEGLLHRKFLPEIATRYFRWPDRAGTSYRLWLHANELVSVSSLSSGGTAISAPNYFLEPQEYGPPYNRLELNLSTSASFGGGDTPQRDISIAGVWGYKNEINYATATTEALDSSETGIDVSNVTSVGVGNLILIDTEYMIVESKSQLDTGQDLVSAMTAQNNDVIVDMADGTQVNVGEIITIDSEQMLITDVVGNNAVVKRGWNGSVLATHSLGASIYAPRNVQVIRGANGSTAAAHNTASSVYIQTVPRLVQELAIAESLNYLQQELSGYARVSGTGENQQEMRGTGLQQIRGQAMSKFGRKARMRTV